MTLIYWFLEHVGEIASAISIVGANGYLIFLSHRKLHKDMELIREDTKAMNLRIDATSNRIDSTGMRIDAMGNRIDNMYTVMMGILTRKAE